MHCCSEAPLNPLEDVWDSYALHFYRSDDRGQNGLVAVVVRVIRLPDERFWVLTITSECSLPDEGILGARYPNAAIHRKSEVDSCESVFV